MLSLEKSQQFQSEYKEFQNRINKITDEKFKTEMTALLVKLLQEVKKIDIQHRDLGFNNRLPSTAADSRLIISETRRQLSKKLKDWDEVVRQA